jgi:hypothetical protein
VKIYEAPVETLKKKGKSGSNQDETLSLVEALKKKERGDQNQDETQFSTRKWLHFGVKTTVLFCRFFFESHPVLDQTQGSGAVFFPDFTEYSNTSHGIIKWVILLYPQVLMCHSISTMDNNKLHHLCSTN